MYGKDILTLLNLKSKVEIKSKNSLNYFCFDVNYEKNIANLKNLSQRFVLNRFLFLKTKNIDPRGS